MRYSSQKLLCTNLGGPYTAETSQVMNRKHETWCIYIYIYMIAVVIRRHCRIIRTAARQICIMLLDLYSEFKDLAKHMIKI